jgi:hypothetical protein
MYSEFDSDFDYLNSETPQQFEQQTQTRTPEITNIERFWTLTGNWGEFGSYFGVGLASSQPQPDESPPKGFIPLPDAEIGGCARNDSSIAPAIN